MLVYDMLANLPLIDAALADPALAPDRRRAIAAELIAALPTGLSIRGAPSTFEYIRDRIRYHRDRPDGTDVAADGPSARPAARRTAAGKAKPS